MTAIFEEQNNMEYNMVHRCTRAKEHTCPYYINSALYYDGYGNFSSETKL